MKIKKCSSSEQGWKLITFISFKICNVNLENKIRTIVNILLNILNLNNDILISYGDKCSFTSLRKSQLEWDFIVIWLEDIEEMFTCWSILTWQDFRMWTIYLNFPITITHKWPVNIIFSHDERDLETLLDRIQQHIKRINRIYINFTLQFFKNWIQVMCLSKWSFRLVDYDGLLSSSNPAMLANDINYQTNFLTRTFILNDLIARD